MVISGHKFKTKYFLNHLLPPSRKLCPRDPRRGAVSLGPPRLLIIYGSVLYTENNGGGGSYGMGTDCRQTILMNFFVCFKSRVGTRTGNLSALLPNVSDTDTRCHPDMLQTSRIHAYISNKTRLKSLLFFPRYVIYYFTTGLLLNNIKFDMNRSQRLNFIEFFVLVILMQPHLYKCWPIWHWYFVQRFCAKIKLYIFFMSIFLKYPNWIFNVSHSNSHEESWIKEHIT